MRKLHYFTGLICALIISCPALAQTEAPYSEQVQRLYNQTNSQALQEFNKTYPKPEVPKIPRQSESGTPIQQQPAYQNKPMQNNFNQPRENNYAATQENQAAPSQPDITVKNTENKQNSSGYNIYLPPNSSNNNQTQSAPNPYR